MSYKKINPSDIMVTFELDSDLDVKVAKTIAEDIRKDLAKGKKYKSIIFDLRNYGLDIRIFPVMSPLGFELRKLDIKMYVLTIKTTIHRSIYSEGMDKIIRPISDLKNLNDNNKKIAPKLDVNFLNPFIEGTIYVLNVQGNIEVKPLKPVLKSAMQPQSIDIAGIIGLTSKSFQGNIAICFPKKLFLHIMSKMLGEEFTEITDDLKDGAAEITNMILGHAKKILNENGHSIEKALPSVICASDLKITNSGSQDSIVLPFAAADMNFHMEISIENKN